MQEKAMTKQEINRKLEQLLNNQPIDQMLEEGEKLEEEYQRACEEREREALEAYKEEGGHPEDFTAPKDPEDSRFKELINIFHDRKTKYQKEKEEEEKRGIEEKKKVIEELEQLVNEIGENINIPDAFNQFNNLKERWRNSPMIPSHEFKPLKAEYSHLIDQFFYHVNIYKDLKQLDLQKNLEAKRELVDKMKELQHVKKIKEVEQLVREYQDEWDETGPVPHEQWEPLKQEFKEATSAAYQKIRDHYEQLRQKRQKNLEAKQELIQRVKNILEEDLQTHQQWMTKTDEVLNIQKGWKQHGFAPKNMNQQIWKDFRAACDEFFNRKKAFYKQLRAQQKENKEKKQELLDKAESLKDSTDWKRTAEEFKKLQKHWKETGPAAKKDERKLWRQFKAACDHFFSAKKEFFAHLDERQAENLNKKEELIQRIKDFQPEGDREKDLASLKAFWQEWNEIGHVPKDDKQRVMKAYQEALNQKYDDIGISVEEQKKLNYKNKLERLQKGERAREDLKQERKEVQDKIKELKETLEKFETNLSFFNKAANKSNPLLEEAEKNIDKTKEQLQFAEERLKMVKEVEGQIKEKAKAEKE